MMNRLETARLDWRQVFPDRETAHRLATVHSAGTNRWVAGRLDHRFGCHYSHYHMMDRSAATHPAGKGYRLGMMVAPGAVTAVATDRNPVLAGSGRLSGSRSPRWDQMLGRTVHPGPGRAVDFGPCRGSQCRDRVAGSRSQVASALTFRRQPSSYR
jgi:hypothetical protein